MLSYKTEGIIIKRSNFGEADKIITIFTKNHGKLRILGKGIRRIASRRASHLELFNHTTVFLRQAKNLDLATEAQIINSYQAIRADLRKIRAAYFACELIDSLCPEKQVNSQAFELSAIFFDNLNNFPPDICRELSLRFAKELAAELGYLQKEKLSANFDIINFVESIIERKLRTRKLWT